MAKSHRKTTYHHYKMHWRELGRLGSPWVRTRCGKYLWPALTTIHPAEVTCKTCRKFLAYWHNREEQ